MTTPTFLLIFNSEKKQSSKFGLAYLFLLAQLITISYIIHRFEIEPSLHLKELIMLVTGGYALQPFIPDRLKIWFFYIISLTGLLIFTGIENGIYIMLYGTAIVLCATLIRINWIKYTSLALLASVLIGLVVIKNDWVQSHQVMFSTLGSMFMFRLSIMLYDRQHMKDHPPLIQDLSYFFMLPNMAILLFPAVDYKTYLTKQYDQKDLTIYKKGVQWIVLGVFHLILYRVLYYYLLTPAVDVTDLISYSKYAIVNYTLIIRLSGIFHFSVGVLCLFGFNLPKIFNNYFLASGFSDLWRRINIYFRDYLIKVFYYPIFFRIRKLGNTPAVLITILILFALTWLLHSFQWFWVKGKFPLRMVDIIFWGIFGLLVAANAYADIRKSRNSTVKSPWQIAAALAFQNIGMFLFMSILWALWSANSLNEWIEPVRLALLSPSSQFINGLLILLAVWIVSTILYHYFQRYRISNFINPEPQTAMASFWSLAMITSLLFIQLPALNDPFKKFTNKNIDGILTSKLNKTDENLMIEGYYSEILIGNELTNPLAERTTPLREQFRFTEGALPVKDFREIIHKPGTKIQFKGKNYSINSWGMRDKEYSLVPDSSVVRTIILGGSFVSGSGVSDYEVFDEILENKMNKEQNKIKYEFINAGSSGFDLIDCLVQFDEQKLEQYQPHFIFFVSHGIDIQKCLKDLIRVKIKNIQIPYTFLTEIIDRANLTEDMSDLVMMRQLRPFGEEIVFKSYQKLYDKCASHNITPVWIFWPTISMRPEFISEKDIIKEKVAQIGYKVIDLAQIYDGIDALDELRVGPRDNHPNAKGHKLFADSLYQIFQKQIPLYLQVK